MDVRSLFAKGSTGQRPSTSLVYLSIWRRGQRPASNANGWWWISGTEKREEINIIGEDDDVMVNFPRRKMDSKEVGVRVYPFLSFASVVLKYVRTHKGGIYSAQNVFAKSGRNKKLLILFYDLIASSSFRTNRTGYLFTPFDPNRRTQP